MGSIFANDPGVKIEVDWCCCCPKWKKDMEERNVAGPSDLWAVVKNYLGSRFGGLLEYWQLVRKATDANVGNVRERIQKLKTMPKMDNSMTDGEKDKHKSEFYEHDAEKNPEPVSDWTLFLGGYPALSVEEKILVVEDSFL